MAAHRPWVALCIALAACSGSSAGPTRATQMSAPQEHASPAVVADAPPASRSAPEPEYPAYYIEQLQKRSYPGGQIQIGPLMWRGNGFTKHELTWPSDGETMTGTISIPDGEGPFPVLIVEHGYIPSSRYWVGQDSWIFGDPIASHGFISISPNWPGYAGSDPGPQGMPNVVAITVTALNLVSSLATLPRADITKVALAGHSTGGGVGMIAMLVDPRIRAFALYAPMSSDMRDHGRRWVASGSGNAGPLGDPDQNPDGYAHISPRNYFDKVLISAPVIFLQGTRDHTIKNEWTTDTVELMNRAGIRTRVVWLEDGDHDLVGNDLAHANSEAEAWIRAALGL